MIFFAQNVAHAIGTQYLYWSDGSDFTTFGPDSAITIRSGAMQYTTNCEDEHDNDFFIPYTDIYIIPGTTIGEDLSDVSGSPNTVQGSTEGAFALETIGFTGPSGSIGPGIYSVVYDECQDGKLGPEDAVFSPAFEVVIPDDVPPLNRDHIQQIKNDALGEFQRRSDATLYFGGLFFVYAATEIVQAASNLVKLNSC